MSRHCSVYRATDGRWYLELASDEYGEREDADTYGPFPDEGAIDAFSRFFPNPGGTDIDDGGTQPVPSASPNGGPVLEPKSWAGMMGHLYP